MHQVADFQDTCPLDANALPAGEDADEPSWKELSPLAMVSIVTLALLLLAWLMHSLRR
jgi:hypothetical protein